MEECKTGGLQAETVARVKRGGINNFVFAKKCESILYVQRVPESSTKRKRFELRYRTHCLGSVWLFSLDLGCTQELQIL